MSPRRSASRFALAAASLAVLAACGPKYEKAHVVKEIRATFSAKPELEKQRPLSRTPIRNLFLAGDYCKNFIDVVSLEAATVSGLQAAECVRQYSGLGAPIKIMRPKRYPSPLFWPLKLALAPYAVAAKLWCTVDDIRRRLTA